MASQFAEFVTNLFAVRNAIQDIKSPDFDRGEMKALLPYAQAMSLTLKSASAVYDSIYMKCEDNEGRAILSEIGPLAALLSQMSGAFQRHI